MAGDLPILKIVPTPQLPQLTRRHHYRLGFPPSPGTLGSNPSLQNPNLFSPLSLSLSLSLSSPSMACDYHRRRKWVFLFAAVGFSSYGVYRLYNLPSVVNKRRKMLKLIETLISLSEAVSFSADTISVISSDLNRFLRSESDEIPTSLMQASKLMSSDEFLGSLSKFSEALTVGVVRGNRSSSGSTKADDFADRIIGKLFSPSGSGFASVVAGSFARNLVIGFYSSGSDQDSGSGSVPSWIRFIFSEEKSRELMAHCIQSFVSSAVAVYLEKTKEMNTYDDFFAGITNPKHEAKVKEFVVSVCNGAVETLIRTSHQVLTVPTTKGELGQKGDDLSVESDRAKQFGEWFDQVSSTLAVPSNRRFVLDVTGKVTFETVRSFLDFLLGKLYYGAKRGIHDAREGIVERGLEVVRYFSAKSMLVLTICLGLCMRVMSGTRVLMSA